MPSSHCESIVQPPAVVLEVEDVEEVVLEAVVVVVVVEIMEMQTQLMHTKPDSHACKPGSSHSSRASILPLPQSEGARIITNSLLLCSPLSM
jgi:hypothetical protein